MYYTSAHGRHTNRLLRRLLVATGLLAVAGFPAERAGFVIGQTAAPNRASTVSINTATLPSNGKIAFTSNRDGNREIYVMNADGTNQIRLTNNTVIDDSPTWSPDGRKIAFVSQRQDGSFAIFAMNADGAARTEITSLSQEYSTTLSWSPDGGKIAFDDSPVRGHDVFVVNVDGSDRQNLTADPAHDDLGPVWSPDGSKILFSRYDHYEV